MRRQLVERIQRKLQGVFGGARSGPGAALLLALGALVLLDAGLAAARPGGGNDFSGGGGGGSGGGSGGFAVVWIVVRVAYYLIDLCVHYPAIGLPIVGAIAIGGTIYYFTNSNHTTKAALRDLEDDALAGAVRDLRVLADRDPQLREDVFLQDVSRTVLAVQQAWIAGDLAPVRRLLSDGVYNRFTALLAMNRARGVRNAMADSTIDAPAVAAVERDAFFDTVHVRVAGKARDADVPLAAPPDQAAKLLQRAKLAPYVEVWSFLRRPGAQTKAGHSVIEGRCPNCGAEQPVGDVVECPFCHALVNSGEYGWVLAEITQASEWRPGSTGEDIPGLAELRVIDANVNRQQIEDRASFLFWKWVEARVTRQPAAIRKISTARMSDAIAAEAAAGGGGGGPTMMERVAVGSADLVGVEPGGAGGMDRALVRIRWSAAYAPKAAPMPATNVLVLVRQAGVATRLGLSGDRCKSCGAPLVTATDSPKCDYCGAELAGGKQDWVLDELAAPTAVLFRAAPAARPAAAAPAPAPAAFAGMAAFPVLPMVMPMAPGAGMPMMQPQQPMMPQQQPMTPPPAFPAPAAQPPQQPQQPPAPPPAMLGVAGMLAPAVPDDDDDAAAAGPPEGLPPWALPDMSSPQERAALLARMAVIAAADGVVTRDERRLLKKCAKRWGVPFASVEPILASGVASLQALQTPEHPQRFMMGLVAAALVDGKVDRKERLLLDGVARNMGLAADVVPGLITAMTEWRNRQAAGAAPGGGA